MSIGSDPSSDSWGFVGVVTVGGFEAYRTIEAFPTPQQAEAATQGIVGLVLGELLAGAEWRQIRDRSGATPTREDLALGVFKTGRHPARSGARLLAQRPDGR
ncbi:MAG TPA: hypothetical protein VMB79_04645 [Jatrophihabitans sp.]|nr:hypothetical protein [Jatrophihabitans sp.]